MTVVYLDRVLLLNLLVDYLLAPDHGPAGGYPLRRGRGWLCAPPSGARCTPVQVFLPGLSWLARTLCVCPDGWGSRHGAGGVAIGGELPSRGDRRRCFSAGRRAGGGLVLALELAPPASVALTYVGRLCRAENRLAGAAKTRRLGFFGLLCIWYSGRRPDMGEERSWTQPYPSEDRVVPCGCSHDTGNTLRSPVTGQPVLVLEQTSLGGLRCRRRWKRIVTRRASRWRSAWPNSHATDLVADGSVSLPFAA
ncbi:MAG: hypothetical protein ACLU38_09050 [Dysosmobacter sp.]